MLRVLDRSNREQSVEDGERSNKRGEVPANASPTSRDRVPDHAAPPMKSDPDAAASFKKTSATS